MLQMVGGIALSMALLLVAPSDLAAQAGPRDRQRPNPTTAAEGRNVYAQGCINCHGLDVKGTENGPDLIRSVAVLRDFEGSEIGPALGDLEGHPMPSDEDLVALSHFLKEQIEATSRNRNPRQPPDVLTGDAEAGLSYFNGAGGCRDCHSVTGDLAGIGGRYRPIDLQQRFLFPRRGATQTVTVTPEFGQAVSGTLEFIDDFFVSLRDTSGTYQSFRRTPRMSVETQDPYQAHWDLLERITDAEIHDVVTYLETVR